MPDTHQVAPYMSEAIDEFIKGIEMIRDRGAPTAMAKVIDTMCNEAVMAMRFARGKLIDACGLLPKEKADDSQNKSRD